MNCFLPVFLFCSHTKNAASVVLQTTLVEKHDQYHSTTFGPFPPWIQELFYLFPITFFSVVEFAAFFISLPLVD